VNVTFPALYCAVLTLHVPVPFWLSVITQTTLPPDLTVTVPPGLPTGALALDDAPGSPLDDPLELPPDDVPGAVVPDDEQPAAPSAAPRRTTQRTRGRTRMDHHHCYQNGHEVSQ
jgi:hypothetical protein